MHNWTTGTIDSAGVSIAYERAGNGPSLVFLHGMTDSGACWRVLGDALAPHYDVVLVDARGHGKSAKPTQQYMPTDHAHDVMQLITQLSLKKPLIVGHSMGAMTALAVGALYAAHVSAVILEDPPLTGLGSQRDPQELVGWNAGVYAWIDSMQTMTLAQLVMRCMQDNPTWQAAELIPWAQAKLDLYARVPWFEPERVVAWQSLMVRLAVPTLLVLGDAEQHAILTAADARAARELSPLVEIAYIRHVGHCVRREAPAAYKALVREFAHRHMEV